MTMTKTFFCLLVIVGTGLTRPATAAADAEQLLTAVRSGDIAAVQGLLHSPGAANAADATGTTALHWAVHSGNDAMVETLLQAGADVNAANRYGVVPLTLACINANVATVKRLLDAGANVEPPTTHDPLILVAARSGNVEIVRLLAARGADVNVRETWRGQTALMWAVAEQHADVASALVELGADVRARSKGGEATIEFVSATQRRSTQGFSALMFAVRTGDIASARVLLGSGADVNEMTPDGKNILLMAIENFHYDTAAFLVQAGADVNSKDRAGFTPLHFVTRSGMLKSHGSPTRRPTGDMTRLDLMKLLLTRGADSNARTVKDLQPRTAETRDAIHDRLIEKSVSLGGATPFFLAAQAADVAAMRLLVEHGASPTIPTFENTTPLAVAAGVGYFEGVDNPTDSGVLEAVRLLLQWGNDVTIANTHGQTPLHGAVYRGTPSIIQVLVDHNAPLRATDILGRTPLKLAEEGFYQVNSILRRDAAAQLLATLGGDTPEDAALRHSTRTPK